MATETTQDEGWRAGPAIFAIGWIPTLMPWQPMPLGFRESWSWPYLNNWLAWKGMLTTGNNPPPDGFDGIDDLQAFIDAKEFRAVAGFHNVKIRPPQDGEDHYIGSYERLNKAGFTPLRILPLWFKLHSQGEEAGIQTTHRFSKMTYLPMGTRFEFRVGKILNFFHWCLTGHRLWHASIDVHYYLEHDGTYYAEVNTTNIPNVTVYCDWKKVATYSLADIKAEQVRDFVTAERRRTPPESLDRFSLTGQAGEPPGIGHPPLTPPDWF